MTARTRRLGLALFSCGLVLATSTWAFFPIGAYDSTGVLRYERYDRSEFDRDNNGDIDQEEGIPVYIENGRSGFTEAEIAIVEESLRVWERVPQSYASTQVVGFIQDPIFAGQFLFDGLNTIAMQVTETQDLDGDGAADEGVEVDPPEVIVGDVMGSVLGASFTLWAEEEAVVESGGLVYTVPAGTIIDNDIVINASAHRPGAAGEAPVASLLGTMVHELGHFYGLGHTPLNAVQPELSIPGDPSSQITIVESAILNHSIGGVSNRIGVTPTMYAFLFESIDGNGVRRDGGSDLAPDDISGIAWLYPRGNQDLFFSLSGEARTRTTAGTGLPSAQIPSGHVVAWADVDNDETTPRVAVFSTLTSLFVNSPLYPEREGRFEMNHLWKTMETESGIFNATYTFSNNPLNNTGYERQAPPGAAADDFDSILPLTVAFNNVYPSEVLHEAGNIIDVSNKDAGTPFVWDFERQTLISTDTERTISSIVGSDPMFGDPNDVCILNVVSGSTKALGGGSGLYAANEGATTVRALRDTVLLETALGSFVVDTYYSVSPTAARFLLSNSVAYGATVQGVKMAYWCLDHYLVVLAFSLAMILGARALRSRMTRGRAATAMIVAFALLGAPSADARLLFQSTEQLAAAATDIVAGKIVSATARQESRATKIYTDIVIEIEDTAKGTLNKQSTITFTQLGGRVGGLVSRVSELPQFKANETVVLYLVYVEGQGYSVYNGLGGKTLVSVDRATSAKTVAVSPDLSGTLKKSLPSGEVVPDKMTLSDYMATLRSIVKAQKADAQE